MELLIGCAGLAVLGLIALWVVSLYNGLVARAQRVQERVRADRRAAQAPLRPDPEPGRDGQGLHEARARDAGGGDRRAQRARSTACRPPRRPTRATRRAMAAARRGRGRARAGRWAGCSRCRRGLSGPQGQPEHDAALRGADLDREQGRVRAPGLQRRGHDLQQRARDVPGQRDRGHVRLRAGGAARDRRAASSARPRRCSSDPDAEPADELLRAPGAGARDLGAPGRPVRPRRGRHRGRGRSGRRCSRRWRRAPGSRRRTIARDRRRRPASARCSR